MSTIVEELKKKIKSSGGDASGVQTISDGVKKMSVGGGSAGVLTVYATYHTDDGIYWLLEDVTAEDIYKAIMSDGKSVQIIHSTLIPPPAALPGTANHLVLTVAGIWCGSKAATVTCIGVNGSGEVITETYNGFPGENGTPLTFVLESNDPVT